MAKKKRLLSKELSDYCEMKMPKTNYDRYFVEELVKKYPKLEQLEKLLQTVKDIDETPENYVEVFLKNV